jgi:hypothetical protein
MKKVLAFIGVVGIISLAPIVFLLPLADENTDTGAAIASSLALYVVIAGFSIAISLSVATYMLPTLIAIKRHHRRAFSVAVLDILLGWTIVGWAIALIWSWTDAANSKGVPVILPVATAPPLADFGLTSSTNQRAIQ